MGASVNRVIIVGNVTRDPEVKHTQGNQMRATFSVATNESWKDKSGEWQERVEYHRVVCWRWAAEKAAKALHKGKQVYVEGKLETRKWQGEDGADRYTTEIVAREIQPLGPKSEPSPGSGEFAPPPMNNSGPDEDDDLPF